MAIKIILLGLKSSIVEDVIQTVKDPSFDFVGCTTVDELKDALHADDVTNVFMGAGLDLEIRIEAARTIFATSPNTHIHMKKAEGGPNSFGPFIRTFLVGLKACG